MKALSAVVVAPTIAVLLGCLKSEPLDKREDGASSSTTVSPVGAAGDNHSKATNGPDEVLRRFLLAMTSGDEVEIRATILDNPDASILWQGTAASSDEKVEAAKFVYSATFQHLKVGDEV